MILKQTSIRGYVQGGSDGMPILGDFAVKYGSRATELGVPSDDLYQALVDTAENTVSYSITYARSRLTNVLMDLCSAI